MRPPASSPRPENLNVAIVSKKYWAEPCAATLLDHYLRPLRSRAAQWSKGALKGRVLNGENLDAVYHLPTKVRS